MQSKYSEQTSSFLRGNLNVNRLLYFSPPDIWLRYVDDTFTVLQESEVEHFTHHLNSMDENIKFTVEPEQDNTLAFLDTCVCLNDDGSTKVKIYRKATHTE